MARSKKAAAEGPLSEAALTVLLRERFAGPEFAFIPQVRNGTGYSRGRTRTADALAMSLWPSRGLELWGFELKSARADWMREKADPSKAEEIGKYCDRWWVVAGAENVVQQDDLFPPTWGLMVAIGRKLKVVREAPKLEALPLDRVQLAAILRRAADCVVPRAELDAAMEQRIREAEEKAEASVEARVVYETRSLRRDVERLTERQARFENASGLDLDEWRLGNIAEAAKFIADGGLERLRPELEGWLARTRETAAALEAQLALAPAPRKTGTEG